MHGLLVTLITLVVAISVVFGWLFASYRKFTKNLPKPAYQYPRVRPELESSADEEGWFAWIGHSTVYMNLFGVRILTDPVFSEKIGVSLLGLLRIGPKRHTAPALKLDELSPVNVILLSHAHMDHLDLPSLRKLADPEIEVITARGTSRLLRGMPFKGVYELGESEEIVLSSGMKVKSIPVRHWGRRFPWNSTYAWTGYSLEHQGRKAVFAGDTAMTQTFKELSNDGPIDVMMMPIGAYSPDSFQTSHCTPEQAWEMFQDSGARWLIPIHHDTFVLSREPVKEPLQRLFAAAGSQQDRIVVREHGGIFRLQGSVPEAAVAPSSL
ncbi:MAG: hypothetical protein A2201_03965 [Alicyclobacillus sp. RIFOXYA1_FULL_53_8]|nr:MAG: hypothetical protein A2201_03965 [Alicyclobacillus sp. RIFOXYA1_FULL_53_8]